jgi:uncharacterized protein YndB with AHSA1/START domain
MPAAAETNSKAFVMSRVFDAPRALLWQCFTDAERMKHWWGPKGHTVLSSKMDLRVGGTYHYGMKTPDGGAMWGLFKYREIVPQEKLVFVNAFSDEQGGITRHPGSAKWPLYMLSTFTFEDAPGGKTKFTVTWRTLDATAEEQKTFDTMHDSMTQGWGGTMDQLAAYLAKAA